MLRLWILLMGVPLFAAPGYRVLLVAGSQWADPSSTVLEGGSELNIAAALLKTWAVPFDIHRLDQQGLDDYHLLDRDGEPLHGTIIWAVGPELLKGRSMEAVARLVRERGVTLVALSDSVAAAAIGGLAGVEYVSDYRRSEPIEVAGKHYLTGGLIGNEKVLLGDSYVAPGHKVTVRDATALASRGPNAFVTLRQFPGGGRVIWLGVHRGAGQLARQAMRDLFKRCLVFSQGALLYAEYPNSVLIEMHDNGNAEKTISPSWHLRTLSESQLRESVIEPLKRHGAVITQVVNTGFVDRKSRRVLNPWKLDHVPDELDPAVTHNYASTKRGLDAGLREGVFEINSHGWTHILPDLDSPPGPFWDAPVDGVGSLEWYNEFADRLRKRDIPAALQRVHMQRSLDYLRQDFGVEPLFFRPPGGAASLSMADHTPRIAASMGFGLTRISSPYFLSHTLVLQLGPIVTGTTWAFTKEYTRRDAPLTPDGPFFLAFHDRDVANDAGWFERVLMGLGKGIRYVSANEYVAYLHTAVERDEKGTGFRLRFDPRYCAYFAKHPSVWTIETAAGEKKRVTVPAGLGPHVVN